MSKNENYVEEIMRCCRKREKILIKKQSTKKYNYYYDKMITYAQKLILENRQDELLPYLEEESVSIKNDVAGLLFNYHTEKCTTIIQDIVNNPVVPLHFAMVQLSAMDSLKYGIPKNYPFF